MIKLTVFLTLISLFSFSQDEFEGYIVKKENLTKRDNQYWDSHKTRIQASGKYYKDEYGETTEKHGEWKYYDKDEKIEEERNYYKDMLHGKVVLYYPNGKLKQEGYFYLDRQDSIYREWSETGVLMVEGTYKMNKPVGEWKYAYRDGHPKSVEESREGMNYMISFWSADTLHTQTIKDGNGVMRTFYTTGNIKEFYTYKNGLKDGKFEEWSIYGYLTLEGEFKNGLKEGEWKYAYYTGDTEKISHYKDDKLDGEYKYFYDNGQVNVEGRYAEGMKTGQWTWYTNSGSRDMQGDFKAGEQNGDWTYWYPTGETAYYAHYDMGKKTGQWTYLYKNGQKFKEGTFGNDVKNGNWKTWYENGTLLMDGNYKDGLEDGAWTNHWEDGEVKNTASFKGGLLHGEWASFYPSGKMKLTGKYDEGNKTGEWTDYFENGKPREIKTYKVFKKKSQVDYGFMKERERFESMLHGKFVAYSDKDFKLMEEGSYNKGQKDGEWKAYHPGGRMPAVISHYKEGELNGLMETFDKRGNIISDIEYKDGLKHGSFKVYDKKGRVISEKKFSEGMQVIEGQDNTPGSFSPGR